MTENVRLNCSSCGRRFTYIGESPYYATCPVCGHDVRVKIR